MTATSFITPLAEGFAELLAAASIGLTWSPSGAYTSGQTGIFIAAVPTTPNRIVTITPTPLSAHPTLSEATYGLQIRTRSAGADIRDVWALRDAIRYTLAGLFPMKLPTDVYIASLMFAGGASLGQDDLHRWEWSDNWSLLTSEPRR